MKRNSEILVQDDQWKVAIDSFRLSLGSYDLYYTELQRERDFITVDISSKDTTYDVYIDRKIRTQTGLTENVKLYLKCTGEIPISSYFYVYVHLLESL